MKLTKTSVVVADAELALRLSCPKGLRWLRIEGLRYANQDPVPLCWTEVCIFSEYSGAAVKVGRQLTGLARSARIHLPAARSDECCGLDRGNAPWPNPRRQ